MDEREAARREIVAFERVRLASLAERGLISDAEMRRDIAELEQRLRDANERDPG